MNMENGKATPQLLAFWLLLQCMTWHPSLSLPAWQKSSVHTQHVCTCSRAHTYHISVSKWKPKKTSNRTHRIIVFYILRGQKKKKARKPTSTIFPQQEFWGSLFLPGVCTVLHNSDVLLSDLGRTSTTLWPPKISSGTRRKWVRISQVLNSNQGPCVNIHAKTERSLFK